MNGFTEKIKLLNSFATNFVMLIVIMSLILVLSQVSATGAIAKISPSWAVNNKLVAHAMGSIDGISYTNSLEAFKLNYAKGYRVFEVDFIFTSDNKLVAQHEWQISCASGIKSYSEYMNTKICGKYTPMDVDDIMALLQKYPDIYIITDTKDTSERATKDLLNAIYKSAIKIDPSILDRIDPQIYSQEMYSWVKSIYNFKDVIYTLYQSDDTNEQVIDFVQKNNISMVVMPLWRCDEYFIAKLRGINVITYAHTVNTESEKNKYEAMNVYGFYTDELEI